MVRFSTIEEAIKDISAGRAVVVADDEDRENEGDLIFAAELATPELMAFMVRYTSGFICAPLAAEDADRLELPPMCHTNQDRRGTAYTVTVDARDGITTGISAADRTRTVRILARPESSAGDLCRPGHVVPLRAREGGVLRRPGHTEAAIDLTTLAGLRPAGVLSELVNDDGTMMRLPQLRHFASEHGLSLISIADLIAYRRATGQQVGRLADIRLPTRHGVFRALGYRALADGSDHIAMVFGDIGLGENVLTRVHSECLTGNALGSLRCDCGPQLQAALARVAQEGRGVVLHVSGHEGRGIGLMDKLRAYQLQDQGRDTVEANLDLGLPVDARDYAIAARILADIGVRSTRLLTNNPAKLASLQGHGLSVLGCEPLPARPHPENLRYLRTKRDRMGHLLEGLDQPARQIPLGQLISSRRPQCGRWCRLSSAGLRSFPCGMSAIRSPLRPRSLSGSPHVVSTVSTCCSGVARL